MSYHFFYSNNDSFSNFYDSPFKYQGIQFLCSEQFFMYLKAKLFKDEIHAEKILKAITPNSMKINGRLVENFDPIIWDNWKKNIMYIAVREKVKQNEKIKQKLLKTAPDILVEASPRDTVWGVGLAKTNPLILDKKNWRGTNLLGYILTEIRNDIIYKTSYISDDDEKNIILLLTVL
jgi:ribA/ribD-fused uncharacterized protein